MQRARKLIAAILARVREHWYVVTMVVGVGGMSVLVNQIYYYLVRPTNGRGIVGMALAELAIGFFVTTLAIRFFVKPLMTERWEREYRKQAENDPGFRQYLLAELTHSRRRLLRALECPPEEIHRRLQVGAEELRVAIDKLANTNESPKEIMARVHVNPENIYERPHEETD